MLPIKTQLNHNGFGDLNRITKLELDQIPIWDLDNPVSGMNVFGNIKFFTILAVTWCVLLVIFLIGTKLFLTRFRKSYVELRSIAATPY